MRSKHRREFRTARPLPQDSPLRNEERHQYTKTNARPKNARDGTRCQPRGLFPVFVRANPSDCFCGCHEKTINDSKPLSWNFLIKTPRIQRMRRSRFAPTGSGSKKGALRDATGRTGLKRGSNCYRAGPKRNRLRTICLGIRRKANRGVADWMTEPGFR